jgi:hypothetical protein
MNPKAEFSSNRGESYDDDRATRLNKDESEEALYAAQAWSICPMPQAGAIE